MDVLVLAGDGGIVLAIGQRLLDQQGEFLAIIERGRIKALAVTLALDALLPTATQQRR